MSEDTKMDFYLRNRVLIEEWAALRSAAVATLEEALLVGARELIEDSSLPPVIEQSYSILALPITSQPLLVSQVELNWSRSRLFRGSGGWPEICIVMDPKHPKPMRDTVRDATSFASEPLGLINAGATRWWIRSGPVTPRTEPIVIESYAALCIERFRDTWIAVHDTVETAIRSHLVAD